MPQDADMARAACLSRVGVEQDETTMCTEKVEEMENFVVVSHPGETVRQGCQAGCPVFDGGLDDWPAKCARLGIFRQFQWPLNTPDRVFSAANMWFPSPSGCIQPPKTWVHQPVSFPS